MGGEFYRRLDISRREMMVTRTTEVATGRERNEQVRS